MRKSFNEWDYSDAQQALGKRQGEKDKESLAYVVEKDNWQNGNGWSGPQITGADSFNTTVKEGINKDFTPSGAIPSVVRRHRRGVVGRESGWVIYLRRPLKKIATADGDLVDEKPTKAEQDLIDEAEKLLLEWWNKQRGLRLFRTMVTHYATVGRGSLRLFWPPGRFTTDVFDGKVEGNGFRYLSFDEAIKRVFLLAPKPEEASVITDEWTMEKAGVYTFDDEEGKPAIGLCYVNEQGRTVIKTLKSGSSNTQIAPGVVQRVKEYFAGSTADPQLALNGNLLIFEIDGEPLITEPVKRQQKLLDKAGTVLSHEMDEDGFREEVYYNAMPPGKLIKVEDPDHPGQYIEAFVKGDPSAFERGPGKRPFVHGLPIYEENARGEQVLKDIKDVTSKVTEPVPVDTFIKTADFAYQNILKDTDQLHVLISSDATSSGESRKQARDDYVKSLDETKSEVDYIGSSVFETFLSLIAIFAGKPGYFNSLRVSFNARIDPGPLASSDREMNIKERDAGLKSTEEAMQYSGVADPDAMKKKIIEEQKEKVKEGLTPPPIPPESKPNGESETVN